MTSQGATRGGLEQGVNSKDALKWIQTAKVVLNGHPVTVPRPELANHVMVEYVKPVEGGYRYNVIFYQAPPGPQGYLEFGAGKVGIETSKIYQLPPDAKQIHLGVE